MHIKLLARFAIFSATLVLLNSCAPQTYDWQQGERDIIANNTVQAQIHVITDPPGARITYNDEYLGDSPCDVKITIAEHGTLKAIPNQAGEYEQSKRFSISNTDRTIPKTIFFNMYLGHSFPSYNVNVNGY